MTLGILVVDLFQEVEHDPEYFCIDWSVPCGFSLAATFLQTAQSNGIPIYGTEMGTRTMSERIKRFVTPERLINKPYRDAFYNTDLQDKLDRENITELFLLGFNASICVRDTISGARQRNYTVYSSPSLMFGYKSLETSQTERQVDDVLEFLKTRTYMLDYQQALAHIQIEKDN